jgi:hypothetical protein
MVEKFKVIIMEAGKKTVIAIMLAGLVVQILVFLLLGMGLKFWAIPFSSRCPASALPALHQVAASNICDQ